MKKLPQHCWMSLWRHFFDRERTADQLAAAMIEWQEKWNWDFLKINPAACYHVLDWGAVYEFHQDPYREPKLEKAAVECETDIERISGVNVKVGVLGEQLKVITGLRSRFGPDLPIIETVFSPIEIAHRLMNGREALTHLRKNAPASFLKLLNTIAEVFREFCLECLKAGADGIFFATKWATQDSMTWSEYEEFGKRYEMPILRTLQEKDALVVLHVCGAKTYLKEMLDYPVDIFSYDFFAEDSLPPQEVLESTGKFVLGGIDPLRLESDFQGVVQSCRDFANLGNWLAGPSCVLPPTVSEDTIRKLRTELDAILRGAHRAPLPAV